MTPPDNAWQRPATASVRRITASDVERVVPLMAELGYPTSADVLAARLCALSRNPADAVLVAEFDGSIVGLTALHSFELLHIPGRTGRITALVVSAVARKQGIGTQLLHAAEKCLVECGCTRLEVASAERRSDAHAFYEKHGYIEKRRRFMKSVPT